MNNIISGHAPGHIRDAFKEAIDQAGFSAGQALHRKDWGRLWNCTDTLPGGSCDALGLPRGSTYAQAVRSLS